MVQQSLLYFRNGNGGNRVVCVIVETTADVVGCRCCRVRPRPESAKTLASETCLAWALLPPHLAEAPLVLCRRRPRRANLDRKVAQCGVEGGVDRACRSGATCQVRQLALPGAWTTTMSRFLLKFSGGHSVFRLQPDRTLRV